MSNSQSGSTAIWVAIIAAIGGVIVALINISGPSSNNPSEGGTNNSVCVDSEFSTEGDNSGINCSN